ncbi:MAG: hypothetical protein ACFB0D_14295 [Phormidesmis sp.]
MSDSEETPTETVETSVEIDPANREGNADIDAVGAVDEEGIEDDDDSEESNTEGVNQKNVKLVVKNQTTAGQIIVEQVATSRDGWLSIHRAQEDGGILLPDSIGEARVDSGDSEDIVIDLWEAPDIGEKLWVLLHIDGGERGLYEFPGKDAAVKKNGETMARSFVIQDPNSEEGEEGE